MALKIKSYTINFLIIFLLQAQINLTPDRRTAESTTSTATTTTTTNSTTNTTPATTTTAEASQSQPTAMPQQVRPNLHEIRIDSFPIDIRNMSRHQAYVMQHIQDMNRRQQTNNNSAQSQNTAPAATATAAAVAAAAAAAAAAGATNNADAQATPAVRTENASAPREQTPSETPQQNQNQEPVVGVMPPVFVNNMNPNMEFFMEVTPESITIDSLETTVVTSAAQADNSKYCFKFSSFKNQDILAKKI